MPEENQQRPLTYGEKAVGITFNPSSMPEVDIIKWYYAAIIDQLNAAREVAWPGEKSRLLSIAITQAQDAQMWAVKAITRQD